MEMEILRYLGIAFASSVLLLVLSKIIMQAILRRPADYYLKEEYKQEELILNSAGFSIRDEVETTPEGEVTEEHIHVEPQIPRPEPEEEPKAEPEPTVIPEPEPIAPEPEKPAEPQPTIIPESLRIIDYPPVKKAGPEKPEDEKIPSGVPLTKSGKPRKPSMSMKKDELIAIAEWKGIDLPPKATKAEILELIENAE